MSAGEELVPAEPRLMQLVNPASGEALELTASEEDLAAAFDAARELEGRLKEYRSIISLELLRRMDAEAKWTVPAGRFKAVGESPGKVEYDADKLLPVLAQLVKDGKITPGAAHDALERPKAPLKVKMRGVNALLKLGGEVKTAIEACADPVTKPRSVSVKLERPS